MHWNNEVLKLLDQIRVGVNNETTPWSEDFLTAGNAADGREKLDLGTISTQNSNAVSITGGSISGPAGGVRATSSGTDTIAQSDSMGAVIYGGSSTVTITSGLTAGSRVLIGASATATLTWSVSGGESVSEASTALIANEARVLLKVSSTVWRVLRCGDALTEGYRLVRSFEFGSVTPATSMSVTDAVTGSSYTWTLPSTTGWTAHASGLQYTPSAAGADLETDLDTLLGSSWQDRTWLVIVERGAVAVPAGGLENAVIGGATDQYVRLLASTWEHWSGAASTSGAITSASVTGLALLFGRWLAQSYTATATDPAPADLTYRARSSVAEVPTTGASATGRKLKYGVFNAGSGWTTTISAVRVYYYDGAGL